MLEALKERAEMLERETFALYYATRDPRTPWPARLVALAVVAYALSPIDLIPDPIPVLGLLDDLLIVPAGVALVLRLVRAGHGRRASPGDGDDRLPERLDVPAVGRRAAGGARLAGGAVGDRAAGVALGIRCPRAQALTDLWMTPTAQIRRTADRRLRVEA